jgi:hypothetical protein
MLKEKLTDIWEQYYIHKYDVDQLMANKPFLNNQNPLYISEMLTTEYQTVDNIKRGMSHASQ